jgi:peptidoglycan LD-endopeptidase LytH
MMTPDAFHKWIVAQKGPRVEIISGLHAPNLAAGGLADPEVTPGKPLRAGGYAEDRSNDNPGDYGPTIILEHTVGSGAGSEKFHTLYGHLSRDSLKGLKPGAAFMAGEPFAQLGTKRENGGWPPHLHFQVLLDIGKAKGDYPGVCKRSEQDRWLAICPDPRPLLGLALS